jgi:hypothetical protein
MAFQARIGFVSESQMTDFTARFLPRVPGCRVEAEETPEEPDEASENAYTHWLTLSITSPTAARDLCHQLTAFITHLKKGGALLEWKSAEGATQTGQLSTSAIRDAEIVAMRLSASVKAYNSAAKAPKETAN